MLFNFLGGLALFLFGMKTLSSGLEQLSGDRMRRTLARLCSTPLRGVLVGAAVTAAIQSSSATTVMVVGFVNSGLMQLSHAVGIIMGANLGTTATSWILSLTGLEGGNFFVRLLKPSTLAPILAFVGIVPIMFAKKDSARRVGGILSGLGILFFGMQMMSDAVKPLSELPSFRNLLTLFENPIAGLAAGIVLTAIIQSSSASVGILQALSASGGVTFATAIPIIMGQNIGTCVTTLLSSVGASRNAKRAAFIHLYFNVIGTGILLTAFYGLNYFVDFAFYSSAVTPFWIAMIHTIFNVASTVILFPFSSFLRRLAEITVAKRERKHKKRASGA